MCPSAAGRGDWSEIAHLKSTLSFTWSEYSGKKKKKDSVFMHSLAIE